MFGSVVAPTKETRTIACCLPLFAARRFKTNDWQFGFDSIRTEHSLDANDEPTFEQRFDLGSRGDPWACDLT
jgi:hypothetical protein